MKNLQLLTLSMLLLSSILVYSSVETPTQIGTSSESSTKRRGCRTMNCHRPDSDDDSHVQQSTRQCSRPRCQRRQARMMSPEQKQALKEKRAVINAMTPEERVSKREAWKSMSPEQKQTKMNARHAAQTTMN